ncbi:MAG: hypothetical protein Q9180_005396 [Flavoplaca navasiana]
MVSRKDGAPPKPLAIAGRCKPMKVEKSKKVRVHKVKQGTPPKLSASQKRKLVRLYVFTNLSWKEISELILHYGRRDIKKRALQYTLQNLLSAQYNQMRPRDTSARRQRALQMQRYLDSRHPKRVKSTKSKATSPPSKSSMLQNTGSHDYTYGEPNSSTSTERSEPTMSPKRDQIYFNEFDRLIGVTGYPQDSEFPLLFNRGTATSVPSPSAFGHGADQFLQSNSEPQPPELEGDLEWPVESLPVSERGKEQDFSQEIELNAADADLQIFLDSTYCAKSRHTKEPMPDKSPNGGLSVAYAPGLPDSTPCDHNLRLSGHSAYSSLTDLVNRLSKCSLGEKEFIKDTLRRFSVSTVSSGSNSSVYRALTRTIAESHNSMDNSVSFKPARSQSGRSALLPGDFITSDVNTFWSHIACRTSKTSHCDSMVFCESCFQAQVGRGIRETWCIPFAVIQVKKSRSTPIWCHQGNPRWVDRFGNTSLHIAAALGATCEQLQDIIKSGEVNTQLMTSSKFLSLTDYLRRRNFKFDHRDVMGFTFIDLLKSRGMDFASCLPASVAYSFRKELYEAGKTAEVVPPWSDEWREAWSYSGSTSLCELPKVPKHILSRFKHFADYHGQNYLHIAVGNTTISSDISEQTFAGSRLSLVRDLLSIGVEPDHHDNWGETPLMTHIRTVPEQDDIITELLHSGADVNARNEKGETALHISVRLGNIVGTKALLAQRATVNVHVRNWDGKGVLAVAAKAAHSTKDDVSLYAKITTCMALGIDAGAIMAPTLFDEWDLREPAREILRKNGFIVAPKEDKHR